MTALRINVLGPVEVLAGTMGVDVGGAKQTTVLSLLVAEAGRVVSSDRIIDEIWGESAPSTARHTLQTYVSNLRRALRNAVGKDPIVTARPGYRLDVDPGAIDAVVFSSAAQRPDATAWDLTAALSLWRGAPYEGLADDVPTLAAEATRLAEVRLQLLEARVEAELASGQDAALVPELEGLVERHPLRERMWAALMTALYRAGRQGDALRAYQRARGFLGGELGIEPSAEVRDLEERILLQDPGLEATPPGPATNLPTLADEFVGRDAESARVAAALGDNRLVTVTGPGGIGKTRLAIEVANANRHLYTDGVYFVDLGSAPGGGYVHQLVRESLHLADEPGRPAEDSIVSFLTDRSLLLVFDNCEHVLETTSRLAWTLVTRGRGVTILSTSQELLGVEGEHAVRIGPIGLDHGANELSEAAALFRLRSAALGAPTSSWDDSIDAVERLCRLLDGVPLALELAAARTTELSPPEIAERLGDRFALLRTDRRAGLSRHATLREATSWSYGLLSAEEQLVFDSLAILVGSFDLEAVEAVASPGRDASPPVLDSLGSLVRRSLLQRIDRPGRARYRMLQSLREFGLLRLRETGELAATAARHARHFMTRLERLAPLITTGDGNTAMHEVEADLANHRAAFDWNLANDVDGAVTMNTLLANFWAWRHHQEGADWSRRTLAAGSLSQADRARTLAIGAWLAYLGGDQRRAEDLAAQSVETANAAGAGREPLAVSILAQCATLDNRPERGVALADEARALAAASGEGAIFLPHREITDVFAGVAYIGAGRREEAVAILDGALSSATERGDRRNMANTRWVLGGALRRIDLERSLAELRTAIDELEGLGVEFDMALAKSVLSVALIDNGDFVSGIRIAVDASESALRVGDERNVGFTLEILALFLGRAGLTEDAVVLYGAGHARRMATGNVAGFRAQVESRAKAQATLERTLGSERYRQLWERGNRLTPDDSVSYAADAVSRLTASMEA